MGAPKSHDNGTTHTAKPGDCVGITDLSQHIIPANVLSEMKSGIAVSVEMPSATRR